MCVFVGLHQVVYNFSTKTAFFFTFWHSLLPQLECNSGRYIHPESQIYQMVAQSAPGDSGSKCFTFFKNSPHYKEVIYSVILMRSQNRAAFY